MMSDTTNFLLLPEQSLPAYIRSAKDIYERRNLLKQLLLSEYTLNYLMDIIIFSVKNKTRIRTLDCLKVIRSILRNNPFELELANHTISKLFFLHRTFIFHRSEEVRACANILIKSQPLDDESINWIIANWDKSEHLLNRLLRYPVKNPLITKWAREIYQNGNLKERDSEVIGLLIDVDGSIPSYVRANGNVIIWSIYYSRISDEIKQKLLIENFSMELNESLWKVATRLKYSGVLEFMRQKVREQRNYN